MTDKSNELNELMLKSIIDKLDSFTDKLENVSNIKTEHTPDYDNYIKKLHGLFDQKFSQLLKHIGSIKIPLVKDSINTEMKDSLDTILKQIKRDSDVTRFIKKRLFVIITILTGLTGFLVFLNFYSYSKAEKYELNALKYKTLRYLGDEIMVENSRVIDNYFIETPIDTIKFNIKRQELIEKQRIHDYRIAKQKEDEAKKLIEEANKLKKRT